MFEMGAGVRFSGLLAPAMAAVLLVAGPSSRAGVIETKSLVRSGEAIVVKGTDTPDFYGLQVNNADATLSPNQIFAWAYDSATGWRQVVFQIDEVNNANPNAPPPTCTAGYNIGLGPNHMQADDGLWDSNDELVFMCEETGDRVSLDLWAPGAVTTAPRYEIAVTDPLDTLKKGWVYLFRYDSVPTWRTDDYVAWSETTNTVSASNYSVDYPDAHQSAVYFTNLNVKAPGGGTGTNMVQKSKLSWNGGFGLDCTSTETQIRTEQTITGGGCVSMTLPWYAKDGRVRVLRYFIWSPYCWAVTNGIGMWPCTHIYYYKSSWQEDANDKFHGGSGHTNSWWSTVNHANTTNMTFYDSNGENCTINGTAETLANTPLWTWYQVSSSYGSYIKVLRDTAKLVSPDSRKNLYTDSGTGSRGDAGYRIENPTETTEDAWDHNYYFFLPANAANQGATYNGQVDNPLGSGATSQTFVASPPQDFAGILLAADENGPCQDQGVRVTWDNALTWNDGCTGSCTSRRFEIRRDGVTIYTVTDVALSTWVDTTGNNGVSYDYSVEACNQNDACTAVGGALPAMDYVAANPNLSDAATGAADASGCAGDGVRVTWTGPSDWYDNGTGARRFDLYWSADAYASPIATGVTSPAVYDAPDGVARQYRIRAVNGCDLTTDYTASTAVTDAVGTAPTPPAVPALTITDLASCSLSGITVAWNPVADWGDGDQGTRKYDLYWSGNGFAVPLVSAATSPVTIHPPNDSSYTYRVVATNGCALLYTYPDGTGSDGQVAPAFAGLQSVTDGNLCIASPLTFVWPGVSGDGASGWNDGGAGPGTRAFEVYRGAALAATLGETSTGFSQQPPATNTAYTFSVRAVNKNGCYTDGGSAVQGTDAVGVNPVASPGQTSAADISCSTGNGVTVSWDAVTDWGDGGQGESNRRYRLYWSGDNFTSPLAVLSQSTLTYNFNPTDNVPYKYRIVARNGCGLNKSYLDTPLVIDRTSCSPPCVLVLDNSFDPTNGFAQTCNGTANLWALTAGVGNGGSAAWRCDLEGAGVVDSTAVMELTSPQGLTWTQDVKLRFWSSSALALDDAGVVEVWTNDSSLWKKIQNGDIFYPNPSAEVPASIESICPTDTMGGNQPAFQGSLSGTVFEAKLDGYLTAGTTQIKVRFKAASGADPSLSQWVIDDVQIGYGITDGVYFWSLDSDLSQGAVKAPAGDQAILSWEDGGLYETSEFRIYRSSNPANERQDASSQIVRTEPDTDAASYSWTTTDGPPAPGSVWFYKIYGFKQPCGESNQGEN